MDWDSSLRVQGALRGTSKGGCSHQKTHHLCKGLKGRWRRQAPALLTDLGAGLRLSRVHTLRAPPGVPQRSGVRRLWPGTRVSLRRGGAQKWEGGKNITALTPRGSGWLGCRGRAKARARRPGATCPPACPLPTWPGRPAAWRWREVRKHATVQALTLSPYRHQSFISVPLARKLKNWEKV